MPGSLDDIIVSLARELRELHPELGQCVRDVEYEPDGSADNDGRPYHHIVMDDDCIYAVAQELYRDEHPDVSEEELSETDWEDIVLPYFDRHGGEFSRIVRKHLPHGDILVTAGGSILYSIR